MSASVETLSPSKHMIVVSPFNDNINNDDHDQKGMNMMNEHQVINQEEAEEEENGSSTSNNDVDHHNADDDKILNNKVALKSCQNEAFINSSSPSCSLKVSSSLQQLVIKDKGNERRLQKWIDRHLENLNVSSQGENKVVSENPEVEIVSISIKCRGRPEIVLSEPYASSPKACLFTLKEGSRYRLSFSFIVSNKTVSGLKYVNTLWKAGVRVDRSEVMLGSFCPKQQPYAYELEEDTAPSGIFVRGLYCARTKVVDDHENCYLDIKYYFEIQKSWPSCC